MAKSTDQTDISPATHVAGKSLKVAYLCWLFGGLYGLHHFYLGRDKHAFITFATFGGYFCLGLLRDFWSMPEYLKDANGDPTYMDKLTQQMKTNKQPPSSMVRQTGLMIVGNLFALLIGYAIPRELLSDIAIKAIEIVLVPFGSALGVWLVGNVGRHQGSLLKPLLAAYLTTIPAFYLNIPVYSLTTFTSMIVFNRYCKAWRTRTKKRSLAIRTSLIVFAVIIYLSLWSSWLYFNCTIEDDSGETIKCRDALKNLVNSQGFKNLKEALNDLYEHVKHSGFLNLWNEILQEFDLSGKSSAYATLGLTDSASSFEILARYKKLSRQFHPDKEQDEQKKAANQEKFIAVQEAYRRLMSSGLRYKIQREYVDRQEL